MLNDLEVKLLNRCIDRYLLVREDFIESKEKGKVNRVAQAAMYSSMGRICGIIELAEERLGTTVELNWKMVEDDNIRMFVIAGYDKQYI